MKINYTYKFQVFAYFFKVGCLIINFTLYMEN